MNPEPGITMLGGHKMGSATGCCTPDCPACLSADRSTRYFGWFIVALLLGSLAFKVFACGCGGS